MKYFVMKRGLKILKKANRCTKIFKVATCAKLSIKNLNYQIKWTEILCMYIRQKILRKLTVKKKILQSYATCSKLIIILSTIVKKEVYSWKYILVVLPSV